MTKLDLTLAMLAGLCVVISISLGPNTWCDFTLATGLTAIFAYIIAANEEFS